MNTKVKIKRPKPVRLLKAFWGCTVLFCIPGLIITFVALSSTIQLNRVNQDRVDATVVKKVLFVVPVSNKTVTDILSPDSQIIDGGLIREGGSTASRTGKITGEAEDEGILTIIGKDGNSIEVNISPKNLNEIQREIEYFITDSNEASQQLWVVSNWKFGVFLPGGILLFCIIIFFMSAWSIISDKSN